MNHDDRLANNANAVFGFATVGGNILGLRSVGQENGIRWSQADGTSDTDDAGANAFEMKSSPWWRHDAATSAANGSNAGLGRRRLDPGRSWGIGNCGRGRRRDGNGSKTRIDERCGLWRVKTGSRFGIDGDHCNSWLRICINF